jgi:adenylate kinase
LEKTLNYMRQGKLVPDETVLELVRERSQCLRCCGGFVLDGFPRTVEQAQALQKMLQGENLSLTAAVYFELSPAQVVARLSGRRTCPACKATFHVDLQAPKAEGVCDHCGARLVQREDDQPASIRVRMQAYEAAAAPLLDFYRKQGLLITINADGPPDEICRHTLEALPEPEFAASIE